MDHHGWDDWPADDHDPGDAETADLSQHDDLFPLHPAADGLGDHDLADDGLGLDPLGDADHLLWPHEGYPDPVELPDPHHELGAVDAHVDEPLGGGVDHAGPAPDVLVHEPLGYAGEPPFGHPADGPPVPPDPVFGADPDAAGADGWGGPEFPPHVDLGALPDPVDGPPWTDAALLGGAPFDPAQHGGLPFHDDAPAAAELFGYAGLDAPTGDPWEVLRAAEDPATSALARWWGPGA